MVVAKKAKVPRTHTTRADFELFKRECGKWVRYFGLTEWQIDYEHDGAVGERAACATWLTSKSATLSLNKDWETDEVTDERVQLSAFHEVCELLITPLDSNAKCRYIAESEITEARHGIIRRLENTIYRDIKPK